MLDAFERRSAVTKHFRGKVWRNEWDDNYRNIQADGYDIIVTLNGREEKLWCKADSEAGTVETYSGTGELKGEVEIRLSRKP